MSIVPCRSASLQAAATASGRFADAFSYVSTNALATAGRGASSGGASMARPAWRAISPTDTTVCHAIRPSVREPGATSWQSDRSVSVRRSLSVPSRSTAHPSVKSATFVYIVVPPLLPFTDPRDDAPTHYEDRPHRREGGAIS